jgi:hypothetical protein
MFTPHLYFARLRKHFLAFKLKWEHDREISRTRSRWEAALRHSATLTEKPQK